MKIQKQFIIDALTQDEYTPQELTLLIGKLSDKVSNDIVALVKEAWSESNNLFPGTNKGKDLKKLSYYYEKVGMSYYEHHYPEKYNKEKGNKPTYFVDKQDAVFKILNYAFQFATKYNLDFEQLIFNGDSPCIEAYAFDLYFQEWIETVSATASTWEEVAQAPVEDLTAALASCIDYILPNNRAERSDCLKKIIEIHNGKIAKSKKCRTKA